MDPADPPDAPGLSADEACRALGIRRETLYAYVSRGLVRSTPQPGPSRARRYDAGDVARLARRRDARRAPERAAEGALRWGSPVLRTAISTIAGGRYAYRGRDAVALSASEPFERVCALLWAGDPGADCAPAAGAPLPARVTAARPAWTALPVLEAMKAVLPLAAADDPGAWRPDAAAQRAAGARIVALLAAVAGEVLRGEVASAVGRDDPAGPAPSVRGTRDAPSAAPPPGALARSLQRAWRPDAPDAPGVAAALDAALVLCADHELNASAFAARVVAGAGAPPYDAVLAGLAALGGTRHGGHVARVAALVREVPTADRAAGVVADRLRRGEAVPGFGHPLYPEGDPRFAPLRARAAALEAAAAPGGAAVMDRVGALVEAVRAAGGGAPTVDLGLVALEGALGLPAGAALALFAVGRSAGWIAHALEQAAEGTMIRPRARYVGEAVAG